MIKILGTLILIETVMTLELKFWQYSGNTAIDQLLQKDQFHCHLMKISWKVKTLI